MKTVKVKFPILVGDTHRKEGSVVSVTDSQAVQMVAAGQADYDDGKPSDFPRASSIPGAIDPLIDDADPLHAARMGSLKVDDHSGLLALNDAGVPGAPKRAGRVVPDPVAVATTAADDLKSPPKPKA